MILVLVFCLASTPEYCREVRPVLEPLPADACTGIVAQELAAQWLEDHPLWTFKGSRCASGRDRQERL